MQNPETRGRAALAAISTFSLLTLVASPAAAHHPMGGAVPTTFWHGLLSGLGHPVIGLDHFAFVVAVGLVAAFAPRRHLTPLAFVAATLGGCLLQVAGVALPLAEIAIAGSVVLLGGLALFGRRLALAPLLLLFAGAGLFHGWAYGEAIVGAESTPLLAYLAGFALVQYAVAMAAVWTTRNLWRAESAATLQPRLAGALVAGIGLAFLVETIEGLVFA